MMLAENIRKMLRKNADKLGIKPDYIFAYTISTEVRANDVSNLVILISEISDTPEDYGSNRSITREANTQIQIFYPSNFTDDTSKLRYQIAGMMEKRHWACVLDTGIERDPSVDMLVNTAHWRKEYE